MMANVQKMAKAGDIAFSILANDFHRPLIDGKANRDMIEDAITIGVMSKALPPIDQETVDLAISLVNDLLVEAKDRKP